MQIKITLFILFMGILNSNLFAQELGQAVLVAGPKMVSDQLSRYHNSVVKHLNDNTGDNFVLYNYQKENTVFNGKPLFDKKEIPVAQLHYMIPFFKISNKPPVIMERNQEGKVVKMLFQFDQLLAYKIKSIQVATGEILGVRLVVISRNNSTLNIEDYKKYFGADPATLEKDVKKFNAALAKAHEAYKKQIDDAITNMLKPLNFGHPIKNTEFSKFQDELYSCVRGKSEDKDADPRLIIQCGSNQSVGKHDIFFIYTKKSVGASYDYFVWETRSLAEEVGEEKTALGPLFLNGKSFRKLYESDNELFVSRDENFAKNYINKKELEKIAVALEFSCNGCEDVIESFIASKPAISLVDRGSSELNYFRDLARNEAFINYPVKDLQGKQIGAEVLITIDDRYVNAIEVATGKQLASIDTKKKFLGMSHNTGLRQTHLFEILSNYKQESLPFEWVFTEKESKDALKSGIVYHPLGFEDQFVYEIYTINNIDVNGEQIPQKKVVGEFRASKILSGNLTEANIKDGGKELKKLVADKQKLYIQFKNK